MQICRSGAGHRSLDRAVLRCHRNQRASVERRSCCDSATSCGGPRPCRDSMRFRARTCAICRLVTERFDFDTGSAVVHVRYKSFSGFRRGAHRPWCHAVLHRSRTGSGTDILRSPDPPIGPSVVGPWISAANRARVLPRLSERPPKSRTTARLPGHHRTAGLRTIEHAAAQRSIGACGCHTLQYRRGRGRHKRLPTHLGWRSLSASATRHYCR
jgi:hypothetical protein